MKYYKATVLNDKQRYKAMLKLEHFNAITIN